MSNVQQAREALGARLRELRQDARLTGRDLAQRLGWQPSKVSKIELGRQTPSVDDITTWAKAVNRSDAAVELIALLRDLESFYVDWRRQLRKGVAARQRSSLELEGRASRILAFETATMPGLLQTAEYAHARLAAFAKRHGAPASEVADAVAMRMRRQEVLYRPGKKFHFVLTEAVLRYGLALESAMLAQLDRLLVASTLPSVRLGVVPFGVFTETTPLHGFWVFGKDLVLVETLASELRLTQPQEVEFYIGMFEQLARTAVYGRQARDLILKVADDLTRTEGFLGSDD